MIAEYNNKSLAFGVPGLVLQIGGNIASSFSTDPTIAALGGVALIVGTILLIVGLAYYAIAKGRHPAWCLMGFLSIIGLIVLAYLKDYTSSDQQGST